MRGRQPLAVLVDQPGQVFEEYTGILIMQKNSKGSIA